ncbi:toxin glutamine deamidase domain-containing protein [Kitasatospora sp. NPDC004745]|uniref:toxin glutamine deamidase domain-containing protein n=1 Tax=Kitasatospora sp. NPDC004745 TaxID=3364019 RepID=UPI0036B47017
MARKLPEELAPVLARTGHQWPQADEDGLRRAAGLWREFAVEADRLTRRGGESARRVTSENSGHAVDAFGAYWQAFTGGGKGHLDDAHAAVGLVAGAFDQAARAVDGCKAEIVATLRELAAELRQAEQQAAAAPAPAAPASAAPAGGGADGIFGGLRRTVAAATTAVRDTAGRQLADAKTTLAVETAGLKIGGLLDELGRGMKDALATALRDPAAVALLRLGAAPGVTAASYSYRTAAAGAFDARAAGLPAALGEPGVLGADGTGLVLLTGRDGKPLVGVPGLTVELDGAGQPVLGQDGRPVILRADGTPLPDAAGLLVVTGPDGRPLVGVADPAVGLDEHGRPLLTGPDGRDGRASDQEPHGLPLAGLLPGGPAVLTTSLIPAPDPGPDPDSTDDPATGPTTGPRTGPRTAGGVGVAVAAAPDVLTASFGPDTAVAGTSAATGGLSPDGPVVASVASGTSVASHATGGWPGHGGASAGADWSTPARAGVAPVAGGGGGGWSDGDYPLQQPAPAPAHTGGNGGGGGPVTVRTDSVLAPPAGAAAPSYDQGSPETPPSVRTTGPVGAVGPVGVAGHLAAPAYGPPSGAAGPLVGGGGYPGSAPAPFGSAAGVGGPGAGPTGAAATPGAPVTGAPGTGAPAAAAAATGGPQPGPEPRPGAAAPRPPIGTAPYPVTAPAPGTSPGAPPAQAVVPAPPVVGPNPARPEPHQPDGRRRDSVAPVAADPALVWGVVPVATAHATAFRRALRARRGGHTEDPAVRPRTLADSRPYGLPGGLAPVDPQHQAELERRTPRDEDGRPLRHPDPAAGCWAEAVNDGGYREPGRANNSLEIALSAIETHAGLPTCAAPRIPAEGDAGERGGRDRAERELGAPFRDLGDGGPAFDRLAADLLRSGHGAQALLLTLDDHGRPHAWNAVNHRNAVTYLDHQLARQGSTPLHPATCGLWAITLTPEGHPLDLTPTP